jgi:hypothetical protein
MGAVRLQGSQTNRINAIDLEMSSTTGLDEINSFQSTDLSTASRKLGMVALARLFSWGETASSRLASRSSAKVVV